MKTSKYGRLPDNGAAKRCPHYRGACADSAVCPAGAFCHRQNRAQRKAKR